MINIYLPDLTKDTMYAKILQTIEDICDTYSMENDFGILSMANQLIVDYLLQKESNFLIDFNCNIDNGEVIFVYDSLYPIFDNFHQFDDNNLLECFADKIQYNCDYKQFSLNIHVKPKFIQQRNLCKERVVNSIQVEL